MNVFTANHQPIPLGPLGPRLRPGETIQTVAEKFAPDSFDATVLEGLNQRGQPVEITSDSAPGGQWTALEINPSNRDVKGVATLTLPSLFEGF